MKYLFTIIITLFFNTLTTSAQDLKTKLKEGDLVFQDLDCGPLCDAIETVTEGYQQRDFSHVAIIIKENNRLRAIEAIGTEVRTISIDSLFQRTPNANKYLVMRLNDEYQPYCSGISKKALQYVGKKYDDRFIMNNDSLYCSELVFEVYNSAIKTQLFDLQPMTYKEPGTNKYFSAWVEYYKSLRSFIPENLPGINPGLISRSPYLRIVE
jgi:uncharacterized protein YycO